MKQLLYTIALAMLGSAASAQITINSVPTVTLNRLDSFLMPLSAGSLPSIAPAINASWDLGTTPVQGSYITYGFRAPTPAFSVANFADSLNYSLGASSGLDYKVWRNMQQSAAGIQIMGEELTTRQAFGLGVFTGNTLDSLVFPTQPVYYNNPLPVMKFPMTLGSKSDVTTNRVVNFNVTVNAYSLNQAPAQHKQVRRYLDSVVGWGRMRVPIPGTGASAWIQVLQVQHSDIMLDSFYLNGVPADPTLLAAIGASQGQSWTAAQTLFYRAGAYYPLAEATHLGATHSSGVISFKMHARDLPQAVGLPELHAGSAIRLYPNPLRDDLLRLELPQTATDKWSYQLTNVQGQLLSNGELIAAPGGKAELRLPQTLSAGVYYIRLLQADGEQAQQLSFSVE